LRDRALEAIEQGILITENDDRQAIIYANAGLERITGYKTEELIGRTPILLSGEQTDPAALAGIKEAAGNGRVYTGTMVKYRKDGTPFSAELTFSPVRDKHGAITHLVGVLSDVTESVMLEGALRQAKKMEALGQLTGGVAHDFNNLLTVILGNAETIADEIQDHELKSLALMVMDAAERGADLVNRLLTFSRRQMLKPEVLNINDVVDHINSMLQRTVGEQISLQPKVSSKAQTTLVDRSLLETAILNLALNARDAMPTGGTLTIETGSARVRNHEATPELKPGRYVSLRVADTGCGMSPEAKERAIEPFFTTKEMGKGTGLGLSMVYGFAQQSGGHVRIQSELGRGTSVEILLPPADTTRSEHNQSKEKLTLRPGNERILVVEDRADVREFVETQLRTLGYDVVSAVDGRAAIAQIKSDPDISLLFSDIVLPEGMDGLQLAERARELRPELRVLFTSGYPDQIIERHGGPAGKLPLLRKPYRRDELAEALRDALEGRLGF
jgi:PAS domain S-box-containing protein